MNYGKYFNESEFACSHCGKVAMDQEHIDRVNALRESVGFPLKVSSGYRCPEHPLEAKKSKPGTHAQGIACDIAVANGVERRQLVKQAFYLGFTGIGVAKTFVHVDMRETEPVLWVY